METPTTYIQSNPRTSLHWAISQLFASKPPARHHPSSRLLDFGAEILFLIGCWHSIFVFHLFVSISNKRKTYVPWKVHPKEHHILFPSSVYHELFLSIKIHFLLEIFSSQTPRYVHSVHFSSSVLLAPHQAYASSVNGKSYLWVEDF